MSCIYVRPLVGWLKEVYGAAVFGIPKVVARGAQRTYARSQKVVARGARLLGAHGCQGCIAYIYLRPPVWLTGVPGC